VTLLGYLEPIRNR